MIIKISEKPVISMDTGKILGTLKGLIYKNNKVTSLYCKFSDKYADIPVKNVYIGSDAIMLKGTEYINMLYTDTATKVYTTTGKEIGTVTSIETNDSFDITGIIVDNLLIEIDKILHMEDIIIISADEIDTDHSILPSTNSIVSTEVNDASNVDEEEQNNLINHELSLETSPTFSQQLNNQPTKNEVKTAENEDELTIEIDSRYNYLVGKKLLENITIVNETYKKSTPIDTSLIKYAIDNNAILKLIMNTED